MILLFADLKLINQSLLTESSALLTILLFTDLKLIKQSLLTESSAD
ncbi:hypothetical protein [Lactococcus lactis]|nr:hypothetical protein [Lactococcus lactis]